MRLAPGRAIVAAALTVAAAAAGCTPVPSAPRSSAAAVGSGVASSRPGASSFAAASTTVPPGATGSGSPAGRVAGTVSARVAVGASLLNPAAGGVWYAREPGGGSGWVGRATAGGVALERAAGSRPAALAADSTTLYVAEGLPDGTPGPRSGVLEALEPVTLEVRRSVPVEDVIVDLLLDAGHLWVLRSDGVVVAYDAVTLARIGEARTAGLGPGWLAAWGGAVWSLGRDRAAASDSVLTRVDLGSIAAIPAARFPGRFPSALAGGGPGGWVGLGDAAGGGRVIPLDASAGVGTPQAIPVAAAMVAVGSELWWASSDGHLGRVSPGVRYDPLTVGTTASAIAWADGRIWVAAETLVVVAPAP